MLINPFVIGDWDYVLKVWSSWQSLNVGILAFISSLIAFSISKYNSEKKRSREFVAAKAFLPEALSELCRYFKESAVLYVEAYIRASDKEDSCKTSLNIALPNLPADYRDVFSKCISTAKPDVGEHLAYILSRLQVHNARLKISHIEFKPESSMVKIPSGIMANIYHLGELQALVNKTYTFARSTGVIDFSSVTLSEFINAYRCLDIEIEEINELYEFTKRACESGN